ncbi:MAG TPA: hypothetical protein V6D22_06055 [Candidatus Obscuribacterales bacterium]
MRPLFAATIISLALTAGGVTAVYAQDKDANPTTPAGTESKGTEGSAPAATTSGSSTTTVKHGGPKFPSLPLFRKSASSGTGEPAKPAVPKASFGPRMASTMVGGVFGIPVSMVRRTKIEVVSATKELVDNSNNKFYLAAASPIGLVGGIVSGCFQGAIFGPYNAYKYSTTEPFSAETFSLGEAR